jgi:hypothetical protein
MQEYAGTFRETQRNVWSCGEYRGIQENTGEYRGIQGNTGEYKGL